MMTGIHRCSIRSHTRARVHGAVMYSGENRPPTLNPRYAKARYMKIRASMKSGVDRPMKPRKVKV